MWPELSIWKFVAVEEPTINWFNAPPATGLTARVATGVDVPIPKIALALGEILKTSEVEEPITKYGEGVGIALIANRAYGEVVPIPTLLALLTKKTLLLTVDESAIAMLIPARNSTTTGMTNFFNCMQADWLRLLIIENLLGYITPCTFLLSYL